MNPSECVEPLGNDVISSQKKGKDKKTRIRQKNDVIPLLVDVGEQAPCEQGVEAMSKGQRQSYFRRNCDLTCFCHKPAPPVIMVPFARTEQSPHCAV